MPPLEGSTADVEALAVTIGLAEAAPHLEPHVRVWAWLANEAFMSGGDEELTELAHNCVVEEATACAGEDTNEPLIQRIFTKVCMRGMCYHDAD